MWPFSSKPKHQFVVDISIELNYSAARAVGREGAIPQKRESWRSAELETVHMSYLPSGVPGVDLVFHQRGGYFTNSLNAGFILKTIKDNELVDVGKFVDETGIDLFRWEYNDCSIYVYLDDNLVLRAPMDNVYHLAKAGVVRADREQSKGSLRSQFGIGSVSYSTNIACITYSVMNGNTTY